MNYALVYIGVDETYQATWAGPRPPGTSVPLREGARVVVGRGLDADLHLGSSGVARLHLIVTLRGDELHFEDAHSTNGTCKDGVRVERGVLRAGERLVLAGLFVIELQER